VCLLQDVNWFFRHYSSSCIYPSFPGKIFLMSYSWVCMTSVVCSHPYNKRSNTSPRAYILKQQVLTACSLPVTTKMPWGCGWIPKPSEAPLQMREGFYTPSSQPCKHPCRKAILMQKLRVQTALGMSGVIKSFASFSL
jgi:hypothetical protein